MGVVILLDPNRKRKDERTGRKVKEFDTKAILIV